MMLFPGNAVARRIDVPLANRMNQALRLNREYILDQPGTYRFEIEGVAGIGKASPSRVRSKSAWFQFTLVQRDESTAESELLRRRNRFISMNGYTWYDDEMSFIELLDYGTLPTLLKLIDEQGSGYNSTGAYATWGLSLYCDKTRLHDAVTTFLGGEKKPRGAVAAENWAGVLAAAETIPCGPAQSTSDLDYVRWDVSWMQWKDRLSSPDSDFGR
jgi:hypothetical protein